MIVAPPLSAVAVPIRPARGVPSLERARGAARLAVRAENGRTVLVENYQSGSARLRFPHPDEDNRFTAVLLNTAGGVTGGDEFTAAISVGPGAAATVTTQAAERIYRRSGGVARIETTLAAAAGSALDWLPQETILFDRSALARSLTADIEPTASLLAVESIVLGRAAMGESVTTAVLADRWRIRRGGRLVFADGLRLDGDTTRILAGGATGAGATALATLVLVAPDAEARLPAARSALETAPGDAGASAWNGMLVARLIARGGQPLRTGLVRLIEALRGVPMPRVWNC